LYRGGSLKSRIQQRRRRDRIFERPLKKNCISVLYIYVYYVRLNVGYRYHLMTAICTTVTLTIETCALCRKFQTAAGSNVLKSIIPPRKKKNIKMKYFTERRYTDIERDIKSLFMDLVSLTATRFEPREINGILMYGRNATLDVKVRLSMVSCYFSLI